MTTRELYLGLVGLYGVERLVELALSRRNARRALARGGFETGRGHFRVMAVLHSFFLVACGVEVVGLGRPFSTALGPAALALAALAQALRWWAIFTLGDRWNVRIVVVPGAPPVTGGPYRWLRHPNYLAVVLELAALPLVHGAWITALAFSVANALLLRVRIRAEEAALGPLWAEAFADLPRLAPTGRATAVGEVPPGGPP